MYVHFTHFPKRHMDFTKLAEILETKGGKIFRNVKIRWISMLAPTKCVLYEYKTLVVKMVDDNLGNVTAKNNYELLCDCDTILGLTCVLPMMEAM
jgi:hypothetical protein